MAKTSNVGSKLIRKVRLEIRKVIAANQHWQLAVDDIIKAARPKDKKAEKRARKAAVSLVVAGNQALADAAAKIFHNIAGK